LGDSERQRFFVDPPHARRRGWVRGLIEGVQAGRLWRGFGRSWVLPRTRVVAALQDPRGRWRQIYGDFEKRPDRGRQALTGAWIAVWGRLALGGMLLHPFQEGLFLSAMRVKPWCRRWGVGGKLVVRAQELARERNTAIWLVVSEDNLPAIRLYERHGFVRTEPPKVVSQRGHTGMRWDPYTG
jgi:ribosomal protein S18 acetylase RimI-like enzyme